MFGLAVLLLAYSCEKPLEDPGLTLSQTEVNVPADGGTFSVAFQVSNPREGAEVSADAGANDWVTGLEVVGNNINFDVAVNEATETRSVDVTVSYPGAADKVFSIAQDAGAPAPFTIILKEVGATSYVVDIIPEDKEMDYICIGRTQAYLDENNLTTDEALFQDDLTYLEPYVEDYAFSGDLLDVTFSTLPKTENVLYVYGIDTATSERLTDIVYLRFTSGEVPKIEADFTITATVNGPQVTAHVTPVDYDGYYYCEAYHTASLTPDTDLYELCYNNFLAKLSLYQSFGMGAEEVLYVFCRQGEDDWVFSFEPSTDYTIVAFAISDEAVVCSDPVSMEVSSEAPEPSDNQLSISVTDIGSRTATLNVSATNDDPYGIFIVPSAELADYSADSEIMDYLLYWYNPIAASGDFSEPVSGLNPETEYSVCPFAQISGYATTGLFRTDFMTTEAVVGDATIEVGFEEYFDIAASLDVLSEIDPGSAAEFESLLEEGIEVLLPCYAKTEPSDVELYYYSLYSYTDDMFDGVSDDDVIEILMMDYPGEPSILFLANYNYPMILLGVAVDENGNPGPLFKSEPFTLTPEGAADPERLKDLFGVTSAAKVSEAAGLPAVHKDMSVSVSVRKDVEAPAAKAYAAPVAVTSSSIVMPDENAMRNAVAPLPVNVR